MIRPAYARQFTARHNTAWVFVGRWEPAVALARGGAAHMLCVPPGSDPCAIDWSVLCDCHVIAWTYQQIDALRFVTKLRAAGALDISVFDVINGEFLALALTENSESQLMKIESEAA